MPWLRIKGAFEGLFILPRLILPNNMRDRTAVVNKVLQNIGLFRKGMFKELWKMPNIVLRHGSFNSIKRAEALARAAGELGAAVKALTSEGVLDAKEHIQKLQALHPQEDHPMMADSLDSMHDDSSSHAPFSSADFRWSVKNAKLKRAADALGQKADIIKQMNSEAVNAICKLYKRRTAANHQFIPEHLRPYFFGARLISIAKKDGGCIRPISIGTIFHKLINSATMCNLKEKLPGTFFPVQFWSGYARRC